jgi:outer membrane receptor protein involved in Fe transport
MATEQNPSQLFNRRTLSLAVSSACAGVAPNAMAQDTGDDELRLEEIIVTATKREVGVQDVPMAITAFGDAEITKEGFRQLDDYVARIPALASARREPGGSNVIMRGCATSGVAFADTQSTAVYLDEQPISVAGINPDPRLVDVQRVEALSGPQGTLFGDSSQCGTLRIITNKPNTQESEGWIDLSAMTVSDGDVGYDVSAMFNVPIADNKAALRFVGFRADEPGYVDNVLTTSPRGQVINPNTNQPYFPGGTFDNSAFVEDDINESTITGGRVGLRIAPADDWTLDLQGAWQEVESTGFGDVDLPEAFHTGDSLGEWEQARFGDEFWRDEWYQLSLGLEASIGWGELTVAASFMNRKTFYEADSTAYITAWQDFNAYFQNVYYEGCCSIYDFGGDPLAKSFDDSDADRTSLEIRLATPSDSDSRWSGVIGAFYNKSEDHTHFSANIRELATADGYYAFYYLNNVAFRECQGYDPNPPYYCLAYEGLSESTYYAAPSVKWWDGVYNSNLEQVALFGEVNIDFNEHFTLTLGGRWFDIETDRTLENGTLVPTNLPFDEQGPEINCDASGNTTSLGTPLTNALCWTGVRNTANSDESGFVPKITTTFNATDDNMFYFTYSEGFRRGGGNAARPTSVFGRAPLNQFESDLVTNFEVGTKNSFADGRGVFNVTAYHMIWDDIQVEVEDPTPNIFTLGLVNLAEAEIQGIEAFLSYAASENVTFSASAGYNNAELSKTTTLFPNGDSPLVLTDGTQLPLVPDIKISASLDVAFDRQILDSDPSLSINVSHTGESISSLAGIASTEVLNPIRDQGDYTITNIRFGLDNDSWAATLYVHNAFDEYAKQFFNDRWIQQRLTVNRPRTIGVSFRKKF